MVEGKKKTYKYLNILTDYVQILFFLVKILNGLCYLFCCYFSGRKDEDFILDDYLGET
jgi:hypothetical protein